MERLIVICLCTTLLIFAGCGGSTGTSGGKLNKPSADLPGISGGAGGALSGVSASAEVTAEAVDFRGWKALRLRNGLVTVTAVPDIGGRVMEYNLGTQKFLWVNDAEAGKLYDPPTKTEERKWYNYGGYKTWPAPQDKWGGPPEPLGSNLEQSRWKGRIITPRGTVASIEMTSPDDAQVTGLRMTRTLTLRAGSTELEIRDTFENVSNREISWSIWGIAQVPGLLQPGAGFSPEAKIYMPVNTTTRHQGGFVNLITDNGDMTQWNTINDGKTIEVTYGGKVGKIGVDSSAGWIAYVDTLNEAAFIQKIEITPDAIYPDQNTNLQVFTNASNDIPYMEAEVLSPIHKLAPGEKVTRLNHWTCGRIGGPVLDVAAAGVLRELPMISRKDETVTLTAEFGVFVPGTLMLEYLDKDSKSLSTVQLSEVTPAQVVKLGQKLTLPENVASARLVINNAKGEKVGDIAGIQIPNN